MAKLIIGTMMVLAGIGTIAALGSVAEVTTFSEGAQFAVAVTILTCVMLIGTGGAIVGHTLRVMAAAKRQKAWEQSFDDWSEARWLGIEVEDLK